MDTTRHSRLQDQFTRSEDAEGYKAAVLAALEASLPSSAASPSPSSAAAAASSGAAGVGEREGARGGQHAQSYVYLPPGGDGGKAVAAMRDQEAFLKAKVGGSSLLAGLLAGS